MHMPTVVLVDWPLISQLPNPLMVTTWVMDGFSQVLGRARTKRDLYKLRVELYRH